MRYNVTYAPDKKEALIEALTALTESGVKIVKIHDKLGVITVSAKSQKQLKAVDGVLQVETDKTLELTSAISWHQLRVASDQLPMNEQFLPMHTGEGSVIYLVDSAVDKSHPEFTTAVIENRIIDLWSFDGDFTPLDYHGTSMASVMIGDTLGVAPKATVKVVKIPKGQVNISVLLEALDKILDDAVLTNSVKVVNCSWVIAKSLILDQKIQELQNNNLVVVAAAGNTIDAADNYSPVGLDTIIGVGASDAFDRVIPWADGNAGSNWGPEVDVFAPGIDVEVAGPDGTIHEASGTSIAAAIVSAATALLIHELPLDNAGEIATTLIADSIPLALFWDEEIYETTPNRLAKIRYYGYQNAWDGGTVASIAVKRGEQVEFTLTPSDHLDPETINLGPLVIEETGRKLFNPEWVTYDSLELTITPPANTPPGIYVIYVSALDFADVIRPFSLRVGVYENSPDDLVNAETYISKEEDGEVVVVSTICGGWICGANTVACVSKPDGCWCQTGFPCENA